MLKKRLEDRTVEVFKEQLSFIKIDQLMYSQTPF